mmetsp:Transcript_23908/g.60977  ORF Transcript_23908/g.60977 Transcript_23908/m.60977 type:complete len:225 (-) Transcript_23908:16-690(-)
MSIKNTFLAFEDRSDESKKRSTSVPRAFKGNMSSNTGTLECSGRTTAPSSPYATSLCSSEFTSPLASPRYLATLDGLLMDQGGVTVMVQNVPKKYTQRALLNAIFDLGCGQSVDLFYLPPSTRAPQRANLGYCFVNFADPSEAVRFCAAVSQLTLPTGKARKGLVTAPARVQGFAGNFWHLVDCKLVGHVPEDCLPVLRDPKTGVEIPFAVAAASGEELSTKVQ